MNKLRTRVFGLIVSALLFLNVLSPIAHAAGRTGVTGLEGLRFECLYTVDDDGIKEFISDPSERPFVEFTDSYNCRYDSGDEAEYIVAEDRVAVTEYGFIPVYSFYIVGEHLHLTGLGMMEGLSEVEHDEWFYKVGSADYQKICKDNASSVPSTALSTIRRINNIYVEKDGYVCVEDNDGVIYYLDEVGNIVRTIDHPVNFMDGRLIYLASGPDTYYLYENGSYNLYDMQGKLLRSFADPTTSEAGYDFLSSLHEGLITTQEASHSGDDPATSVVYFNETGTEVMRFDGYVFASRASCFSGGRAFICQLYKDDGSKDYNYSGNSPTNWKIIDQKGTSSPLKVVNLPVLNGTLKRQMEELVLRDSYEGYVEIKGYEIIDVHPFYEDEEYASCMIEVPVDAYTRWKDSWNKDYDEYEKKFYVPGRIDKAGNVELGNYVAEYKQVVSDYINGCIISYADTDAEAIVNFDTGSFFPLEEHPLVAAAKEKEWSYVMRRAYFMDDGNFMLITKNKNKDYIAAIIQPEGTVIEGPKDLEAFPFYASYYSVLSEYFLTEEKILDSSYNWQATSLYQINMVLSRDELYPQQGSKNYLWGFTDIWGNFVIEPQYYEVSFFKNGYAYVCTEEDSARYVMKKYAKNLIMIDENGKQVDKVVFQKEKTTNAMALQNVYNADETLRMARTILETDKQFRAATNVALLPTGVGETCGYLYDIATFDVVGLITHVYGDVTRSYREEAAKVIAQSLLGTYDENQFASIVQLLQGYVVSDAFEENKSRMEMAGDFLDLAAELENTKEMEQYSDTLDAINTVVKLIGVWGSYVEDYTDTTKERLTLYLLMSNYDENMAQINYSIASCSAENEEMLAIYTIVKEEMEKMYKMYIRNAFDDIAATELVDVLFSEASLNLVEWTLEANHKSFVDAMKTANYMQLRKSGVSKSEANLKNNAYFLAHSIVVKFAEDMGTKDTYQSMQKLYENAIVVNAMVQDLSKQVSVFPKTSELNILNKAIALGEYRLIVLDNLVAYHNACSSGEAFLSLDSIATERLQIQACLDYLNERKKQLN